VTIATINPATGETLKTFNAHTREEVNKKLDKAIEAYRAHRLTSFSERAAKMRRAGEILIERKNEIGRLMTLEMGKPIKAAIAEAEKCATACFYYADNAEAMLAPREVSTTGGQGFIYFQPIGPVLAVMPWNFPFWQVFRFVAPSLMAGNVGLLKHSSNVPQCALEIERVESSVLVELRADHRVDLVARRIRSDDRGRHRSDPVGFTGEVAFVAHADQTIVGAEREDDLRSAW
jgi:succinate-semialdehyde dehydrogenase/glutarate-semialdehyde dehydrogenase